MPVKPVPPDTTFSPSVLFPFMSSARMNGSTFHPFSIPWKNMHGTATSSIRLPLVRVPVEAEIVYELLLKEARKKAKKKRSEGEITWWTTVYEKLIAHHRDMILVAYRDFITATNTANSGGVLASADDRTLKRNR
jgi:hypothetical protein